MDIQSLFLLHVPAITAAGIGFRVLATEVNLVTFVHRLQIFKNVLAIMRI